MTSSSPAPAALTPERAFHVALLTAALPVVTLPLVWGLAQRFARAPKWGARLLALAVLDTAGAILLLVATFLGGHSEAPAPPAPARVGVELVGAEDGVAIARIWPEGPAARAGLEAGDVVLAIDGEPVTTAADLIDAFADVEPGVPRTLRVRSAGRAPRDVEVVPRRHLVSPPPRRLGTFEPFEGATCDQALPHAAAELVPLALGVLAVLVAWLLSVARGPLPWPRWGAVALVLGGAPLAGAGVAFGSCRALGGWSAGTTLVGLLGQGATLVVGGGLVLWWLRDELHPVVVGPRLSTGRAIRLAVLYLAAAIARMVLILAVLVALFPELAAGAGEGVRALFSQANDPTGKAMLVLAAVVLAPVGEELVFRGVLLGGLAQRMRPGAALVLSSVLFGLFHVSSHGAAAVMPAILGLIFGWAKLRTGKLTAPMVLHAMNNLAVSLLQLL